VIEASDRAHGEVAPGQSVSEGERMHSGHPAGAAEGSRLRIADANDSNLSLHVEHPQTLRFRQLGLALIERQKKLRFKR
jgi:hypothetical protein